jgi:type IV pilus assembly protein PilE
MKPAHGFSMIEMLVVMMIVALLAAAAAPAWNDHVIRTRRHQAQATMQRLMLQQERYFTQHGTYLAFSASTTGEQERQFQWWSGATPQTSGHEIEGKPCDGESIALCVQLVATPGTPQVDARFRDAECDQLLLTSTGLRLARGPHTNCWR